MLDVPQEVFKTNDHNSILISYLAGTYAISPSVKFWNNGTVTEAVQLEAPGGSAGRLLFQIKV